MHLLSPSPLCVRTHAGRTHRQPLHPHVTSAPRPRRSRCSAQPRPISQCSFLCPRKSRYSRHSEPRRPWRQAAWSVPRRTATSLSRARTHWQNTKCLSTAAVRGGSFVGSARRSLPATGTCAGTTRGCTAVYQRRSCVRIAARDSRRSRSLLCTGNAYTTLRNHLLRHLRMLSTASTQMTMQKLTLGRTRQTLRSRLQRYPRPLRCRDLCPSSL
jgi:hypothetical protein